MKTIKISQAVKRLRKINDEIRYSKCFEQKTFTAGLIAFRGRKNSDARQIRHPDKDVVCHVLKGRGRLQVKGRRIPLLPGTVCHIPKGTPHDFAAAKTGELVLFYSVIKTA